MGVYSGKVNGGKLDGRQAVTGGSLNPIGQLVGGVIQTPEHFGVSSWNGETGDVTYTAPVTSVNGQTGDVIVTGGVTSVNGEVGDVVLDASDVGALPDDTTYVSSFNGQSGAVTFSETDPTVPSWAKQPTKPTYTAQEVGALPSNTQFVSSFNGQSGAVTYTAPVTSVNGNTGAVTVSEMPSATNEADGTALVAVGGEWTKQTGYGYTTDVELTDIDDLHFTTSDHQYMTFLEKELTPDTVYTVIFDGNTYETTSFSAIYEGTSIVGIGNGAIMGFDIGDPNCPFIIGSPTNYLGAIIATAVDGSHTLTMSHIGKVYTKFDKNYIVQVGENVEGVPQTDGRTDNTVVGKTGSVRFAPNGASAGYYSTSFGSSFALGDYSIAEGSWTRTDANAQSAHAEGNNTSAMGESAHAEGSSTTAYQWAHAEGSSTAASGNCSHAEGEYSQAQSTAAHAEGESTTASGVYSHAEGNGTTASGHTSHAEGSGTTARSQYSHAEGNQTTAGGNASHAEGYGCVALGSYSHAEGYGSGAYGSASHAEGDHTLASSANQHTFGKNNIADGQNTYVEIVGNGVNANNRSNARTLDWSGNEVLAGKLTVGANPTNNMDVATKQYVDGHGVTSFNGSTGAITYTAPVTSVNGQTGDVTVGLTPLIGTTAQVTPTQVATAVGEGRTVAITHTIPFFGDATFANFGASQTLNLVVSTTMVYQRNSFNVFQLIGTLSSNAWSVQMGVPIVDFTPTGTVSRPTITCTPTTASVNSITGVGTLPTLTDDVTNETLSFSWAQGTLPTQGTAQTVMTGVSATSSEPTFSGNPVSKAVELFLD